MISEPHVKQRLLLLSKPINSIIFLIYNILLSTSVTLYGATLALWCVINWIVIIIFANTGAVYICQLQVAFSTSINY